MDVHKIQVLIQTQFEKAGIKNAEKQTADLIKKLQAKPLMLKAGIDPKDKAKVDAELEKSRAKLKQLRKEMAQTPKLEMTKEYASINRELEKTYGQYRKLADAYKQWEDKPPSKAKERALERLGSQIDSVESKLRRLNQDAAETRAVGNAYVPNAKRTKLEGLYNAEKSKTLGLVNQQQGMYATTTIERLKAQYAQIKGVFNDFARAVSRVRSALTKLIPALKKTGKATGDMSKGMRSTLGTTGPLSKMFRTLAISARFMIASMIFSGVLNSLTQGFKELYETGGKTAQAMVTLRNALIGLRGSFAAAFAPILNFVAPALRTLISLLNSAMNAIARFFAVLTGQSTYEAAYAPTKGFESAESAAGGANKKAKEYQKTLLGFDKINKLNEQPNTSGGGGGGSDDIAAQFKEVKATSKLADMVKAAWEKEDFTDVGRAIGAKLEEALDKIPWDGIKTKAYKIARTIATFLNGFNEPSTWKAIGRTIAEGLNTAIAFAYTFVKTFDFAKFGSSLAQGLSEAFRTVDWKRAGEAIKEGIKGLVTAISQFVRNLDYVAVGDAFAEVISNAIAGAISSIPELIKGFPSLMFGIIEIGADIVLGIAQGIVEGTVDLLKSLKELAQKIIKGIKNALGISSPAKTMIPVGKDLVLGILEGLKNTWQQLVTFIKEKIDNVKTTISNAWSSIKSTTTSAWNNIKTAITTPFTNAFSTIGNKADSLKQKLKNFFDIKWKIKLPKIKLKTATKTILGRDITYPTGFDISYWRGGFPEEGPFYMNRGEIAGKFSNGKGVVANNQQITTGISNAVGPAVYDAMVSALARNGGGNVTVILKGDADKLFEVVQTKANNYMQATGQPAFNL